MRDIGSVVATYYHFHREIRDTKIIIHEGEKFVTTSGFKLNHAMLRVKDSKKSLDFYQGAGAGGRGWARVGAGGRGWARVGAGGRGGKCGMCAG